MNALAHLLTAAAIAAGSLAGVARAGDLMWQPPARDTLINTHAHGVIRAPQNALGQIYKDTSSLTYAASWDCGALGFEAICSPRMQQIELGIRVVRLGPSTCEVRERAVSSIDLMLVGNLPTHVPRVTSYAWEAAC